jgi:tetraprenyl-beta-curcumene synthase
VTALGELGAEACAVGALARANARYWPTVLPQVHRGLRRWKAVARTIPDPGLRDLALDKIAHESFNTEVAATLATLAPRRHRPQAIEAIVALQVMYDYLDGLSEEPAADPLGTSRLLFNAFTVSLTPAQTEPVDYYRGAARGMGDGGYLQSLVAACQTAFRRLPGAEVVAPVAREAAQRCGESQTRTHAIEALGTGQLAEWATAAADGTGLTWWEYTAGATASILSVHALIAAAADPRTTAADAGSLDTAYLFISAVSTLLDSVIDLRRDSEEGAHSFVSYYGSEDVMAARIGTVVARAAVEGGSIHHGGHHRMTAAGVAAYYLSAPAAGRPPGRAVKARAVKELPLLLRPALGVFRLWRLAKAIAVRR